MSVIATLPMVARNGRGLSNFEKIPENYLGFIKQGRQKRNRVLILFFGAHQINYYYIINDNQISTYLF